MLVSTKSRAEWHELKHTRIGGSEIGAIMGVNPNLSPLGLYQQKTSPIKYDEAEELPLFIGTVEEDAVAQWFEHQTGLKTRRPNGSYIEGDYFVANPDRLIEGRKEILECKTAGVFSPVAEYYNEGIIPPTHMLQINWYLGIMGFDKAYIACLFGGNVNCVILEHKFIYDIFEKQKMYAKIFMEEFVAKGVPPKAEVKDLSELAKIYGKSVESVDVSAFNDKLVAYQNNEAKIKELKEQMKPFEAENQEIKCELQNFLQGKQGISDLFQIKNTYIKSQGLDTKKVIAEHPEIYDQYGKDTEYYRFTVKQNI